MRASEMIERLAALLEQYGDAEVCINVKDPVENVAYLREQMNAPYYMIPIIEEWQETPDEAVFAIDLIVMHE